MNPNGQNQVWSSWRFGIHEAGRVMPRAAVCFNVARWMRRMFGSATRARVTRTLSGWTIEVVSEGRPADDPSFVARVAAEFQRSFVTLGWGPLASSLVTAKILAGPDPSGRPRRQWVEMPTIGLRG